MAYIVADRVFETSTSTGTGSFNLAGSTAGFRTFVAGVGTGNTCNYEINNGTDWEVGIGTITDGSPDVLARTTVTASSNAGAKVNWGSGTKNVFLPLIASNTAVTAKENTFTATQKIDNIQTTGSSGVAIKNSAGSNVALFGAAAGLGISFLGKINTLASATGAAGLNVPAGTAPTSPVNGDVWSTTNDLLVRLNGATETIAMMSDVPATYLGIGDAAQTYQSVTRTGGVTYTNSTGRPIFLTAFIIMSGNNVTSFAQVSINGGSAIDVVRVGGGAIAQTQGCGSIIIPVGATYVFTYQNLSGGIATTWELR